MKTRFDFGRFRCAIFDLDGTLLNSTDVWAKVDIDFLGKRNIEVPEDFIRKIKTHNFATGSKYVIERFNLDEKPEDIAKEWFDMAVQAYADDIDDIEEELIKANGKIKVVLGKIIVINPVGEGKYPTITPSSKGMLTINGKEIYETTKVNESDEIEFLSNDKLSKNIKVDISKDKMEAYISFEYKNAVKINIKDSNPVENLVIDVY